LQDVVIILRHQCQILLWHPGLFDQSLICSKVLAFLPHREVIPIPENHLSVLAPLTVLFVPPSHLNFWDWYDN